MYSRRRVMMVFWDTWTVVSLSKQQHGRDMGMTKPHGITGMGLSAPFPSNSFAKGAHTHRVGVSLRCPHWGSCKGRLCQGHEVQGVPSPAGSRGGAGAGAGGGTSRQLPGVPEAAPKRSEAEY